MTASRTGVKGKSNATVRSHFSYRHKSYEPLDVVKGRAVIYAPAKRVGRYRVSGDGYRTDIRCQRADIAPVSEADTVPVSDTGYRSGIGGGYRSDIGYRTSGPPTIGADPPMPSTRQRAPSADGSGVDRRLRQEPRGRATLRGGCASVHGSATSRPACRPRAAHGFAAVAARCSRFSTSIFSRRPGDSGVSWALPRTVL